MSQPLREMSGTLEKYTPSSSREQMVAELVVRSRVDCSLNQPTKDEARFIVVSWMAILGDIPTDWLRSCYEHAMKNHSGGPFGVYELCRAWDAIKNSRQVSSKGLKVDVIAREIENYKEWEKCGEREFGKLSAEDQDRLVDSKIEELLGSDYGSKYLSWDDEQFFNHAVNQVKKDLANKALCTSDPFKMII